MLAARNGNLENKINIEHNINFSMFHPGNKEIIKILLQNGAIMDKNNGR